MRRGREEEGRSGEEGEIRRGGRWSGREEGGAERSRG